MRITTQPKEPQSIGPGDVVKHDGVFYLVINAKRLVEKAGWPPDVVVVVDLYEPYMCGYFDHRELDKVADAELIIRE